VHTWKYKCSYIALCCLYRGTYPEKVKVLTGSNDHIVNNVKVIFDENIFGMVKRFCIDRSVTDNVMLNSKYFNATLINHFINPLLNYLINDTIAQLIHQQHCRSTTSKLINSMFLITQPIHSSPTLSLKRYID
jgi:hypothetical protein